MNSDKLEVEIKTISKRQIQAARKVLIDNGIEADEVNEVIQALGYAMLNRELESIIYS